MAEKRKGKIKFLLMLALVAIAIGMFLPGLAVPPLVKGQLTKTLKKDVKIGSVHFSWAGSIQLADIRVNRPDGSPIAQIGSARIGLSLWGRKITGLTAKDITLSIRPEDLRIEQQTEAPPEIDFPVRLSNINATLELPDTPALNLSEGVLLLRPKGNGSVELDGSGSFAPGRFSVSGVLGGRWLDNRLSISVPAFNLSPDTGRLLPDRIAAYWLQYQPRGKISLAADVAWSSTRQRLASADTIGAILSQFEIAWRLNIENASVFAPQLKEPVVDINAAVEGSNREFQVINANGIYRNIRLEAGAYCQLDKNKLMVRVRGAARDIEAYDELKDLFPPHTRAAMYALHMSGKADAVIETSLEFPLDGQPPNATFLKADLSVRGASVTPKWFPYQATNITGNMSITQDDLTITSPLTGSHGSGTVRMSGTIRFTDKGAATNMRIDFSRITPDDDVVRAIEAIKPKAAKFSKQFSITKGTVGGTFTWRGDFLADEPDWAVIIALESITGKYEGLPYEISNMTGGLLISDPGISFRNLRGWHNNGQIEISGFFGFSSADRRNIEIHGRDVELDADLRAALSEDTQKTWDSLKPTGSLDVDALLTASKRPGTENDVRLRVTLKDATAQIPMGENAALPMRRISMDFEQQGDVIRITNMSGVCLDGTVAGEGYLIRAGSDWKIRADVTGANISLAQLVKILPTDKAAPIERLNIDGRVDINKLKLDLTRRANGQFFVEYDGAVTLGDASFEIPTIMPGNAATNSGKPLRLSDINGRIALRHNMLTGTDGTIALDRMRILKATITNVAGKMRSVGHIFEVTNLGGEMFGGHVEATLKGALDLSYFSTDAWIFDVKVAQLAREIGLTNQQVWGELRGSMHLNGLNAKRGWQLTGTGSANVERANLGETALVKNLVNYRGFFGDAKDTTIEGLSLQFKIEPSRLLVDRLLLKGPLVSARGVGTVNTRDLGLNMYFYRRQRSGLLPDLPLIDMVGRGMSWVVDQVQNQLVVVQLVGTLTEPVAKPAVLKDINEQFRRYILFNIWEEEKAPAQTAQEE